MSFRFDAAHGILTPGAVPFFSAKPGAGPRHLAFDHEGHYAYLINELGSTINVLGYDSARGSFHELQTVSTLPDKYEAHNLAAEVLVHPSGKFLYASNRGHESIAVFAVDASSGRLSFIEHVPTQGRTPRHFAFTPAGDFMIVANQDSNNLVVFKLDTKNGHLSPTGQTINLTSPICVNFCVPTRRD